MPSAKEGSLGDDELEPVTSLDLTVTYDYTCEKKTIDPLNSMEELSGLFSFKVWVCRHKVGALKH